MKKKTENRSLTHIDQEGRASMVDVSAKAATVRKAKAEARVHMSARSLSFIVDKKLPKGNAIETSRIAGILAAKRTSELIPLCHPVALTHVQVDADRIRSGIRFVSTATTTGPTGVEMEALTAAAVAALTLYDMIKAVDRGATIEKIRLLEKSGGKSGHYRRRVH